MTDLIALAESLHPHEVKVVTHLVAADQPDVTEETLAQRTGLETAQVGAALGRLLIKGLVAVTSETTSQKVLLTEVGQDYAVHGTPFDRVIKRLHEAGAPVPFKDIQAHPQGTVPPDELSAFIGILKKEQAIRFLPGGLVEFTGTSSRTAELLKDLIYQLQRGPLPPSSFDPHEQALITKFAQKRGKHHEPFRIEERVTRAYGVTETGRAIHQQLAQGGGRAEVGQLTPEMLRDGTWRSVRFRKYTIGLKPARIPVGKKHPYREFLDLVKAKFVGMGFEEMRGPLVENEFWDMDALFMPQFHPARAIHDVYFVQDPSHSPPLPDPLLRQVQDTHERGWTTGSRGWGYRFDPLRTRRLVLRSQGTAVSARTLAGTPKVPGKYFAIARCFRYDQVDATHAPDFYQIEGIVLGKDMNFRTLLGLLHLFAREIAQAQDIRFLPAYFPFTEPSVELHVRHPRLGWMELGGAGLFRPEVTRPLGVDVPVIAWGLGLDRMAMVALEIHDIRDLFSADLEMIRSKPVQY